VQGEGRKKKGTAPPPSAASRKRRKENGFADIPAERGRGGESKGKRKKSTIDRGRRAEAAKSHQICNERKEKNPQLLQKRDRRKEEKGVEETYFVSERKRGGGL